MKWREKTRKRWRRLRRTYVTWLNFFLFGFHEHMQTTVIIVVKIVIRAHFQLHVNFCLRVKPHPIAYQTVLRTVDPKIFVCHVTAKKASWKRRSITLTLTYIIRFGTAKVTLTDIIPRYDLWILIYQKWWWVNKSMGCNFEAWWSSKSNVHIDFKEQIPSDQIRAWYGNFNTKVM